MENLGKWVSEVVTSGKVALKRNAKPNFNRAKIFREDFISIHMTKPLILNRLIQVGFAILDLSKYFHCNTWIRKFPNSTHLFTDTDSLAYEVVGDDLYAEMADIKDEFHFSEYPKDHFLQSFDNKKVVGKCKDECKGKLMLRFIEIRPKFYSFDFEREAHFDVGENGVEVEAKKPKPTSETRIVLVNKEYTKRGEG